MERTKITLNRIVERKDIHGVSRGIKICKCDGNDWGTPITLNYLQGGATEDGDAREWSVEMCFYRGNDLH
jgi:hypothetical protein